MGQINYRNSPMWPISSNHAPPHQSLTTKYLEPCHVFTELKIHTHQAPRHPLFSSTRDFQGASERCASPETDSGRTGTAPIALLQSNCLAFCVIAIVIILIFTLAFMWVFFFFPKEDLESTSFGAGITKQRSRCLGSTPSSNSDLASCDCAWEAAEVAQILRFPPPTWETQIQFLAPGFCFT